MIGRRDFFKKFVRTGLLAGLVGASAAALTVKTGGNSPAAMAPGICNGCSRFGDCALPQQQIARNMQMNSCQEKTPAYR